MIVLLYMDNTINKPSYSMKEMAQLLGCSYATVKKWRAEKRFKVSKIGKVVLVPHSEIERLLEENMEQ